MTSPSSPPDEVAAEIAARHDRIDADIVSNRMPSMSVKAALMAHDDRATLLRLLAEKEAEVAEAKSMRWTPTGDNHHNAWLCPHCNQGNESPQSLTKRAEAAEAELAALKVRLENNERSACGMAEQANIERRRAESAEAELSRVKGEWGLTIEQAAEMIYGAFPYDGHDDMPKPVWVNGGNSFMQDRARVVAEAIISRLSSQSPAPSAWRTIESAPKDGSLVDLSCISPDPDEESNLRVRLTDCSWHVADEVSKITGWIRITDDGDWDAVESPPTCKLGLPAWKPTHWQPLPSPPSQDRSAESGEGK